MVRLGMVTAVLALMAAPLFAQESTDELKKELEALRKEVDSLKAVNASREVPAQVKKDAVDAAMTPDDSPVMTMFKGTKLSGFVDAGYVVSFNHTNSNPGTATGINNQGDNPARLFDNRGNSFYLNAIQLQLERLASKDMIVGYHIELAAGHDVGIYEPNIAGLVGVPGLVDSDITIQEGWAQILAPIGNGLDIRVGKMATLCGAEVLESKDDWNYSRSLLFSFCIPFTHTGVRTSYAFTDMISATLGFNNGYNSNFIGVQNYYEDLDHGKMVEMAVEVKPVKGARIAATMLVGNETILSGTTSDKTYTFDLVASYTMDKWSFMVNYDKTSIQNVGSAAGLRASQSGIALYTKYEVNDWFAPSLRVEYYSDTDGSSLLPFGPVTGNDTGTGSRIFEFTITGEFKIGKDLIFRVEIRHDDSNQHNFVRGHDGNPARGDNTLGFEVIMPF